MIANLQRMTEGRFAGKLKITESVLVSSKSYGLVKNTKLSESTKKIIVEGVDGKEYSCVGVYTFPISRPGEENANGRIYDYPLWDAVIAAAAGKSFPGLMDHPDGDKDGSTKDIWCVWRNLRYSSDRKLVIADCYLVGYWGREVQERLEAGLDVGLSSVGYGEFLDDEKTIDPQSYELDRPADHVLHPSYGVFGRFEDAVPNAGTKIEKSNMNENVQTQSKAARTEAVIIKEEHKMTDYEARQFEIIIESATAQAKSNSDPRRRAQELRTVLGFFDEKHVNDNLKKKVQEEVGKADDLVELTFRAGLAHEGEVAKKDKEIDDKEKEKDAFLAGLKAKDEAFDSLSQRYEASTALLDQMKEFASNMKKALIAEKAKTRHKVDEEKVRKLEDYAKKARETLNTVISEKQVLEVERAQFESQLREANGQLNRLREAVKARDVQNGRKVNTSVNEDVQAQRAAWKQFVESVPAKIKEYADSMLTSYPEFESFRKELYECRSMIEVQQKFIGIKRKNTALVL